MILYWPDSSYSCPRRVVVSVLVKTSLALIRSLTDFAVLDKVIDDGGLDVLEVAE